MLSATNTAEWEWMGSKQKHVVRFEHHTISGQQRLIVDGAEHFKSGWKFKLTGTLCLTIDDRLAELHLLSDEWGNLVYRLTLNGSLVPLSGGNVKLVEEGAAGGARSPSGGGGGGGGGGSGRGFSSPASPSLDAAMRWCLRGKTVEFVPSSMAVLVDGVVQACEGTFVEEEPDVVDGRHGEVVSGVRFTFPVGGQEAELTVLPSTAPGRALPQCVLRVGDVVVARAGGA